MGFVNLERDNKKGEINEYDKFIGKNEFGIFLISKKF